MLTNHADSQIPRNPGMGVRFTTETLKDIDKLTWWLKKFWATLVENATAKRDDFSGETILVESWSNMGKVDTLLEKST